MRGSQELTPSGKASSWDLAASIRIRPLIISYINLLPVCCLTVSHLALPCCFLLSVVVLIRRSSGLHSHSVLSASLAPRFEAAARSHLEKKRPSTTPSILIRAGCKVLYARFDAFFSLFKFFPFPSKHERCQGRRHLRYLCIMHTPSLRVPRPPTL